MTERQAKQNTQQRPRERFQGESPDHWPGLWLLTISKQIQTRHLHGRGTTAGRRWTTVWSWMGSQSTLLNSETPHAVPSWVMEYTFSPGAPKTVFCSCITLYCWVNSIPSWLIPSSYASFIRENESTERWNQLNIITWCKDRAEENAMLSLMFMHQMSSRRYPKSTPLYTLCKGGLDSPSRDWVACRHSES